MARLTVLSFFLLLFPFFSNFQAAREGGRNLRQNEKKRFRGRGKEEEGRRREMKRKKGKEGRIENL